MSDLPHFTEDPPERHYAWPEAGSQPDVQFHRDYVAQFQAWYDTQPGAALGMTAP